MTPTSLPSPDDTQAELIKVQKDLIANLEEQIEQYDLLIAAMKSQFTHQLDSLLEQADDHHNGFGKVVPVEAINQLKEQMK